MGLNDGIARLLVDETVIRTDRYDCIYESFGGGSIHDYRLAFNGEVNAVFGVEGGATKLQPPFFLCRPDP